MKIQADNVESTDTTRLQVPRAEFTLSRQGVFERGPILPA